MNITPHDIRKHVFKKGLRGFDVDEVAAFLDLVSVEYEKVLGEGALLREQLQGVQNQLKRYHDIENTLQETLLSAERAREETVKTATKQAEVIVREAEVKASTVVEEGRRAASRVQATLTELTMQKESFLAKLRALAAAQLDMLDAIDFGDEDRVSKPDAIIAPEPPRPPAEFSVGLKTSPAQPVITIRDTNTRPSTTIRIDADAPEAPGPSTRTDVDDDLRLTP